MRKVSFILCIAMIISIIISSNLPSLGLTSNKTVVINDPETDPGSWYDDNIFEIEFTTAAEIKTSLDNRDTIFTRDTLSTSGVPIKINIKNDLRTTSSSSLKISERNSDKQLINTNIRTVNNEEVNGIKVGKVYLIEATVPNNSNENTTYIGSFGIDLSEDNYLSSDMTVIDITDDIKYQNEVFSNKSLLAEEVNKVKTSIGYGKYGIVNVDTNGYIFNENKGGRDLYKIQADVDGFVDIVLYSPYEEGELSLIVNKYNENCTIDELNVYTESSATNSKYEYVRFYAQEGEEYIINIQNESSVPVTYSVSSSTYASPVWFPQWATSISGVVYWDGTYMDQVYFGTNANNTKQFYNGTNNTDTWIKYNCVIHCFAMIANENNRTTSGIFDIRDYMEGTVIGDIGTVSADPFTVFLKNANMNGLGSTYSNGVYTYISSGVTNSLLGTTYSKFNLPCNSSINYTPAVPEALVVRLQEILTISPEGVFLILDNGNHTVVAKLVDNNIRIFDPGRVSGISGTMYYYNVPVLDYFKTYRVRDLTQIIGYRTFED